MPARLLALICSLLLVNLVSAASLPWKLEPLVEGLELPWSLAFLPDGSMLVTELPGRLRVIRDGELMPDSISGVPEVYFAGQGGLFDILLDPGFADNQTLYLSYADGEQGDTATKVIRARFTGSALEDVVTIFETDPHRKRAVHYGGRMAFMADGTLLITLGDAFDDRELAQNLDSHTGTIVRITTTGEPPLDNPFVDQAGAKPRIWSYGHRNVQAILVDSIDGQVYAHEHGPRGGDELNLITPGKNYGWPAITYGIDYSGAIVSPYTEWPGMEQPLVYWTPSIAPSGMTLYRGELFPQWQGDIFVTSLVFNNVHRVTRSEDGSYQKAETLFGKIGNRLRDIRTGPDGMLYILAEGAPGSIWRVVANPSP